MGGWRGQTKGGAAGDGGGTWAGKGVAGFACASLSPTHLFFSAAHQPHASCSHFCALRQKKFAPPVPHTPHSIMRAHAGRVTCAPPGHGPPAGMRALAAARLRLGPGQLQPRGRCLCRPPSPPDAARAAARNPPTAAQHRGRACIRRRPARRPASTGAWPAHGPGFGVEAYACCVEGMRMKRRDALPPVAVAFAVVTALMVPRRALSRGSSLGGAHVSAVGHHSRAAQAATRVRVRARGARWARVRPRGARACSRR